VQHDRPAQARKASSSSVVTGRSIAAAASSVLATCAGADLALPTEILTPG
jgi:hypothetical protein